jgi:hypothetical protein
MIAKGHAERSIMLDTIKRDIAGRIRRVCPHFDDAEFDQLIDRMADIEMRYRIRTEWLMFVRDSSADARNPHRRVST